jgi:hypothetical protein
MATGRRYQAAQGSSCDGRLARRGLLQEPAVVLDVDELPVLAERVLRDGPMDRDRDVRRQRQRRERERESTSRACSAPEAGHRNHDALAAR